MSRFSSAVAHYSPSSTDAVPPRRSHIPAFRTVTAPLRHAHEIADEKIGAFAQSEANRFRGRIKSQAFTSFHKVPLAPVTILRKTLLKLDLRTMIATGHYTQSIKVVRWVPEPGLVRYRVGFADNDRAHDENGVPVSMTLNELAAIHEYGTSKIPARPHWGPHLQAMTERATVVVSAVQDAVMRS